MLYNKRIYPAGKIIYLPVWPVLGAGTGVWLLNKLLMICLKRFCADAGSLYYLCPGIKLKTD